MTGRNRRNFSPEFRLEAAQLVLDLFSRKPVGLAMSFFPDSALTCKAVSMAWEARGEPANLLYHPARLRRELRLCQIGVFFRCSSPL